MPHAVGVSRSLNTCDMDEICFLSLCVTIWSKLRYHQIRHDTAFIIKIQNQVDPLAYLNRIPIVLLTVKVAVECKNLYDDKV